MKGETVGRYMSRGPFTVGRLQPLAFAHRAMRQHGIRHLPVLDEGLLVGMVSLRDLHLIETLRDVDPETVAVEDAMTSAPFTVRPDTPLREAILGMVEHRYGSAVVMEGEQVAGVFTTTDALKALVALLGGRPRRAPRKTAAAVTRATGAKAGGAKATGAKGTGAKGTGAKGTGAKATGAKGTGAKGTGAKATGAKGTAAKTAGAKAAGAKRPAARKRPARR